MSSDSSESAFERKLRQRRERDAAAAGVARPFEHKFDPDLVPDDPYDKSDADKAMDDVISHIDIIDAYIRYCGKMVPVVRNGQREGIKCSCPIPGHRDSNPSAWINLDKQAWYCGVCNQGGDAHDLAAYSKGFPVPGYKIGGTFHKLREEMATDYGFVITKLPGGAVVVTEPTIEPETPADESIPPEPSKADEKSVVTVPEPILQGETDEPNSTGGTIIDLYDDGDEEIVLPTFDWRRVTPENSFLDEYMKATVIDDAPEEYHFFHALIAVGFALGRDVRLFDMVPVFGNLFICTLGRSGAGKSKARYHLDTLLSRALPHDWTDPNSKGVRKISTPGSAEVLIHNFQKPVPDPSNPKLVAYNAPVRGLIDYNELSALVGRTARIGNVIKPTMMQFYDMESSVATSSMTTGLKEASLPFASALTTTQPKALKNLLGNVDDSSGFLNRWVFVAGRDKKKFAFGGERVDMTPAVAPLESILGWASTFGPEEYIEWSTEAGELFTDFFHRQIEVDKKRSQNDLIVRIDLLMKKLILLFTANRKLRTVPVESVQDAIHLYEYLVACYGIPADQIGNTLTSEVTEAIMFHARKQFEIDGKGVTASQIARSLKRRKYPLDLINKTIDALVKIGFLELTNTKATAQGRPTTRYKYVG